MTLLEIYETYENGNKKAFFEAVKEYGIDDFLIDIIEEYATGVLITSELHKMSKTIKTFKEG